LTIKKQANNKGIYELSKLKILIKIAKIIGVIFLIFGIVGNPYVIEKLFDFNENQIYSLNTIKIAGYFLLFFGLLLINIKRIHPNILLLLGTIILFLILFEFAIVKFPFIFGEYFTNLVQYKHHTGCDGIFEYDPLLKIDFMKRNFSTKAYWNGYYWLHKTDKWGFRNSNDKDKADVILVGDSFVYGTGLNQNQTVAYFIEKFTNLSVMNLAHPSHSSFEEAYLLNQYGFRFKPKYVIYFFFLNDIRDVTNKLNKEEIDDFANQPIEQINFKPRRYSPKPIGCFISSFNKRPYLFHLFKMISYKIEEQRKMEDTNLELMDLGWKYTKKAIQQMEYASGLNDAEFIVVPITLGNPREFRILKEFTTQKNITFIDITYVNSRPSFQLPNDGHFNEEGMKAMAEIISFNLNKKE